MSPPLDRDAIARLFDLTDRVAIVTGGSRGIGLACARAFAVQGANVVLTSRKAEVCDAAAAEIVERGGSALSVPGHLGELGFIAELVEATVERFGGVDILMNNAANPLAQPIGQITEEAWAKSFDVNLRAPVFLFQEALPHLLASDHASVINVLSAGAFIFTPQQSLYGAGKAGLLAFTRSMAAEYTAHGIRVNALAPGTTDTAMTRNTGEASFERMKNVSFMGRIADADEMVGAALYLASDAGSYQSGQCITVDGGFVPAR